MKHLNTKIRERSAKISNRYPELFTELSCTTKPSSILCYGCGFGEECLSIAQYFPNSIIYGVDISEKAIRSCKNKCQNISNITILSLDDFLKNTQRFDMIFALNVFKKLRGEYTKNLYELQLSELSTYLNLDGLLVLDGIQYDFTTTEIFKNHFKIYSMATDKNIRKHKFSFNNYCFQYIYSI
jgi:SAM-dependent methyltransferase